MASNKLKISLKPDLSASDVLFLSKTDWLKNPETVRLGKKHKFHTSGSVTYVNAVGVKTADEYRELGYKLFAHLNSLVDKQFSVSARGKNFKTVYAGPFIEGLLLGDYNYQYYKSKAEENTVDTIFVDLPVDGNAKHVLKYAKARAAAQCLTRDLVNGSPEDMTTSSIENAVNDLFRNVKNVTVEYYGESELFDNGMEGHLAVNRASVNPAATIKITYEPKKWKKDIVLVGKGLTYDSGGLDIKTAGHMQNMKCDKAGAMTVIGIMKGLSVTGSDHKVTAYLGMAENMVGGNAYKADDVLTMMNGTTVHVKNTDAEGRIVLFDNLCLAEEENPKLDEIYTFATLTGAAVAQFGNEGCGMVGFNDKMKKKIKKIGDKEGEVFCNAEFHKFMMNGVDDKIADISNMGTPTMGCAKAGLFLTKALTKKAKKKYLHLDIAGPAFAKSAFGTNTTGGTGFAVRTFINYLSEHS